MGLNEVLVYRTPEMKRLVMGQDADQAGSGPALYSLGSGAPGRLLLPLTQVESDTIQEWGSKRGEGVHM